MTITTWDEVFEEEELSPEDELMRQLREAQQLRHEEMQRRLRENDYGLMGGTNVLYGHSRGGRSHMEDSLRSLYPRFEGSEDGADVNADEIVEELEAAEGNHGNNDEQEDSSRLDTIVTYLQGFIR